MSEEKTTSKDKARQAMGELDAAMDSQIMNHCLMAMNLRYGAEKGFRDQITATVLKGNELHFKTLTNMLARFEELMHSGKTLRETVAVMRQEGWHSKAMDISL